MLVSLFITCLVDQLSPSVGASTVKILRRAGCRVEFDNRQTCCGQPAFNTGYRSEAAKLARKFVEDFENSSAEAIVSPSGSCTAMIKHFPELFADDEQWRERARRIAARTYELSDFLVNVLKIENVGASFHGRVAWHDACHALRDLGLKNEPRRLIENIDGATLVELPNAEACCGFGGTFAVKYPEISAAILDQKIAAVESAGIDVVASSDASCLMQIRGGLVRQNSSIGVLHLAELLAAEV